MIRDALDRPIFASRIAPLENHQDAMTMRDRTALNLDQLNLQRT